MSALLRLRAGIGEHERQSACRRCPAGFAPGLWILRHLSCGRTTRRLPKSRGCRLPIERVIAWTMLLQMPDARDSLLDARAMAGRHPPQQDGRPFKMLEPIGAAAIEALVHRLPDKALKRVARDLKQDIAASGQKAILRLAVADQATACERRSHSSKPMRPRRTSPNGTSECCSTRPPKYRASGSRTTSRGSPTAFR